MRDLHNNIAIVKTLAAQLLIGTTDLSGVGVDRQECDSVEHVAVIGASGDTLSGSLKIDVKLQHSDDLGSNYVAVTDANDCIGATPDSNGIITTIDDAAEDDVVVKVGYRGSKRYSRLVFDITGTHTNGTPVAAIGIQHRLNRLPVA